MSTKFEITELEEQLHDAKRQYLRALDWEQIKNGWCRAIDGLGTVSVGVDEAIQISFARLDTEDFTIDADLSE